MKTILTISLVLIATSTYLLAGDNSGRTVGPYYGVSASVISTGTGHGVGYTINGNITKGRKSLEAGIIYSERESKIAGGDIKYRVFLGNMDRLHSGSKIFTAYLQYNLIYQKGMSYSPEIVTLGDAKYVIESDPGMIATIGHYISYGNKVEIFKNTYLDTSIGFGYYKGSLNQVDGPGTFGIHNENSGFTYSFKIGIGYSFE